MEGKKTKTRIGQFRKEALFFRTIDKLLLHFALRTWFKKEFHIQDKGFVAQEKKICIFVKEKQKREKKKLKN